MNDALVTLLAAGCSVLGSVITTIMTRNGQNKSNIIGENRNNRVELYKKLYHDAERLRTNRELVYDEWYENCLIKYIPDIRLFASEKVVESFLALGSYIHEQRKEYKSHYKQRDPHNDLNFFDENNEPLHIPQEIELAFEAEMQAYRKKHLPDSGTINAMVFALCDAMRDDLGTSGEFEL